MKDTRQIIRELVEEVIEEMTATGAVSIPASKTAFGRDAEKSAKLSMPGSTVTRKTKKDDTSVEETESLTLRRDAKIVEEGYKAFKRSGQMGNKSKAPYLLTQARRSLREAEYLVKICDRFMTECGYTNDHMWNRTEGDLLRMQQHLVEISKGIKRLSRK